LARPTIPRKLCARKETVLNTIAAQPVRRYRYYDLVLAGFVAVLLC
jgi:hypothetical protein